MANHTTSKFPEAGYTPRTTEHMVANASVSLDPAPLPEPGVLGESARLLDLYRRKYLGIDMVLKSFCYGMRLRNVYTTDPATKARLSTLILNIVDCRMLCNSMKHFGTARQARAAFGNIGGAQNLRERVVGWLTFLSFFFRVFEQMFGDLGYLQKTWFHQWSRRELSTLYKMFKCFSLLCSALCELHKLRPYIRKAIANARKDLFEAKNGMHGVLARRRSKVNLADEDRTLETASVVGSPAVMTPKRRTPTASPLAPDPSPLTSSDVFSDSFEVRAPAAFDVVKYTRRPEVRSALFLFRNVCDLLVYSQWMQWYRPYPTLEHGCGTLSGLLGVFIVWVDCKNDCQVATYKAKKQA